MRHQRCSEKTTGAFLEDHDVAGLRFELFLDLKRLRIDLHPLAVGRMHRAGFGLGARFSGGVEDGNFERSRQREELLSRFDRIERIHSAGAFIGVDQFVRLLGAALVSEVVKVDCQKRRPLTDKSLALVGNVGFQDLRRHDIFPAVIFKINGHGNLLVELNEYRNYPFIYLLLTGVVKEPVLPRSGTGKRRILPYGNVSQRLLRRSVSPISRVARSAYRGRLDVLRYATDDNRDSGGSVVTQHFIKFSQSVLDRLTHHGSSIKWLRADFCDGERKSYGEEYEQSEAARAIIDDEPAAIYE